MVEPDTIIDGRYKVVSRLGSGGMADVYLAEDELLGRLVAVKLLHHHFAEDQEFVERFRREASSAAGLSHPNIVGIFDRGEWQGTYYIAMEYVAGRSLKEIVREQGALEPGAAIDIVMQILRAARFAHKRGVIHRDLKPHNVILDEEGRARVTDFGIARAGASDMTLTGSIMGTAQYLSPEQAQGHTVSGSSDLYSVGVILYELLTGLVPFDGETAVAIAFKQVAAEPSPPNLQNAAVSPALDALVLRALAKEPARRFTDADEFIGALQRVREALPASGPAVLGAGAPGPAAVAALVHPPRGAPPSDAGVPGAALAADGPQAASGALLLAAGGRFDRDGDGAPQGARRRRRAVLGSVAVLLAASGVALALLLGGSASRVTVPDVIGQTEQSALAALRRAGLTPVRALAASERVASGVVVSQSPVPGSKLARAHKVTVVISSGPAFTTLINVEGLTAAQALARLRADGFKATTKAQPSATIAPGRVLGTEPAAGTEVSAGSSVTVLLSSGPAQVRVPEVVGESKTAAEVTLTRAGLAAGTVTQRASAAQAPGTVLSQSPRGGASLRTGGTVNLTVAQAPSEVPVPAVVGENEAQAAAALGGAGFVPKIVSATTSDPTQVGVVFKQSPAGGRAQRRGATVRLTVGALGSPTTPTTHTTPTTTTPATTTPPTPSTPTTTPTTTPPPAGAG